jgi:hypothetical protein
MIGTNSTMGKAISGVDRLRQAIRDILGTCTECLAQTIEALHKLGLHDGDLELGEAGFGPLRRVDDRFRAGRLAEKYCRYL